MIQPTVSKTFTNAMKLVRPGLRLVWVGALERYLIVHTHEYTSQVRVIKIVQNDDGTFRLPDTRDLAYLQTHVSWELMDRFPDFNDLGDYLLEEKRNRCLKKKKNRQQWIKDFYRDNRKGVIEAVRNMWEKGHSGGDPVERKRRIQVDMGENLKKLGYQQSTSGIILPVDIRGNMVSKGNEK